MTRFDVCLPPVLAQECPFPNDWANPKNFSNDAHDPGGKTFCGILQREYDQDRKSRGLPTQDVRSMTETEGRRIYYDVFWHPYCDLLRPGLDLQLFDAAVNEGTTEAIRILQVAVGVKNDGRWGGFTSAAATNIDLITAIKAFTARRHEVYKETKGDEYFDKDWQRRTDEIGAQALKMSETQVVTPIASTKNIGILPPAVSHVPQEKPMAGITISTDWFSGITSALAGKKTYLMLLGGAFVIIANHFGFLPAAYVPANLDSSHWATDLFNLGLVATGRSALSGIPAMIANAVLGFLQPAAVPTPAPAASVASAPAS